MAEKSVLKKIVDFGHSLEEQMDNPFKKREKFAVSLRK